MRLKDWKLSPDSRMFAYGGDEVELSLWDLERAFTSPLAVPKHDETEPKEGKKRKRTEQLLPAEIWRAKNVPNDELALRVPVHNTSLVFLSSVLGEEKGSSAHLLAGTHHGAVRRYDTRAARKPVANWKDVVKSGPVKAVQMGYHEQYAALIRFPTEWTANDHLVRHSYQITTQTFRRSI